MGGANRWIDVLGNGKQLFNSQYIKYIYITGSSPWIVQGLLHDNTILNFGAFDSESAAAEKMDDINRMLVHGV
jgi:hypothetical protein